MIPVFSKLAPAGALPPSAKETMALTTLSLLGFAANSLLCRTALAGARIDAASFTSVRIVSGAVALALLVRFARRGPQSKSGSWASAVALFAYAIAFSWGYLRVGAGIGSLIVFGTVQVMMVGWGIRTGERPLWGEWLGIGLALIGLSIFTVPGAHAPDVIGIGLMVVSGMAWGIYSLRGRRSSHPLLATADNFARAVPFALAASLVVVDRTHVTMAGVWLAIASGAIASGIGYGLWYAALSGHTATRAALVQLAVPVIATAGGVMLLGEEITLRFIVGGAIVASGVTLAVVFQSSRGAPPGVGSTPAEAVKES